MIEFYLLGAIAAVILGLIAWAKLKSAEAHSAKADAARAEQRADAADQIIRQTERTAADVEKVQKERIERQRRQQSDIDAGRRDAFDSDGF